MTPREPQRPSLSVLILGPKNLQNELLAHVLEKEAGAQCRVVSELDPVPAETENGAQKHLVMVDCAGRVIKRTLEELEAFAAGSAHDLTMALFGLERGRGVEQHALQYGVKGFFYQQESFRLLLKGVQALCQGEIWLSREVLAECVVNGARRRSPALENQAGLSARELEILALISIGANNEEIAEKLFISPHTVKTHLYHIFKKINVPSRLQAALWAAKNL